MKSRRIYAHSRRALACLLVAVAALTAPSRPARAGEKLKPEEIVARHMDSIGAPETRASVTSRIILGTVVVTFRAPAGGQVGGRAVLVSKGAQNAIGMVFDSATNYPQEKIGFDGSDVSTSFVRPGVRTTLGEFLMTNKNVIKQGLVGGALSQAWPLLDMEGKKPKLEYSGTKKVGDRDAYVLKYLPRGGSDLNVSLFFDAETFQHLRTEYTRSLAAQMGSSPDASARQSESRYRMVEDYSDFRKESGLTLPHKYKISLEITLPGGSYKMDWDMSLSQFAYNQRIDPKSFDVDDTAGN